MKIAAIYDIHANPYALEAVLEEIKKCNVDLIIVGGDVVAGPMPNETLTLLQNAPVRMKFILGNAESEVLRHLNGEKINGLSERADEEARWVSKQLKDEHKDWIRSWEKTIILDTINFGRILFCHGTPRSNVEIFTSLTPKEKLISIFKNVTVSNVVCGHTHMQFERKIDNIHIVNAGSVGMPFGGTGAYWLLIDNSFEFRRTEYDLKATSQNISKSNYPYAESFASNNILTVPSENDALKMLTKIELDYEKTAHNNS
ncbi:metallophosphoesterase family protein [Zhouia amylolytica]|uniref:metallophosphoesterase family protein n=1 Tax=Zhouia amylolytica TaxID=376730 RepID=UPI0020CE0FB7|nr:metallophosphoesterase family protein [Zhouia amylolytica]MCQ0112526.1 metallophosphoesterase family protein [Zhouia amylolytica]